MYDNLSVKSVTIYNTRSSALKIILNTHSNVG